MQLHVVNKSPFEKSTFESCLLHVKKGSSILFIEDGIFAALNKGKFSEKVKNALENYKIYALEPDVNARGMKNKVMDGIKLIDYSGFVDLAAEHDAVQSWL
ncbi:MAG: sulfurtransferase complex subunit TusB [Gammaproteobacteria bacterium]|nr:sulfurtransferase complex subunit TusB [Gammaproteobacteria bacterium]